MNSRLWLTVLVSAATTCSFPALADSSSTDYSFMVEGVQYNCQQFGEAYQEIGTFETANFYVNLCAIEDRYFYLGTAKNKSLKSNFIPAYPTEQINTYQADNGNISYILQIKPIHPTLIIQRNGKTVVVETAFAQNCLQVSYKPEVQILREFNHSRNRMNSISDRFKLTSNQIYTSQIDLPHQLQVKDVPESQVFTSIPNHLSSLSNCF